MFFQKGNVITFEPTEAETKKYAPIAEGAHKVTVMEAQFDQDEKGSFLKLELCIDDEQDPFNRRKIWDNIYFDGEDLSDKRKAIGQRKVSSIMDIVEAEDFEDQEGANFAAMRMIGQTFVVHTKNNTSSATGKTYTNVNAYTPLAAPKAPAAKAAPVAGVKKVTVQRAFK